jgi:hypothetical protein
MKTTQQNAVEALVSFANDEGAAGRTHGMFAENVVQLVAGLMKHMDDMGIEPGPVIQNAIKLYAQSQLSK